MTDPLNYIPSEDAIEEQKMLKAISEMGEATITRVYEADEDDKPFEGKIGDLERLLREILKDPRGFKHGHYSLLDPHGHRQTIQDCGKGWLTCMVCNMRTRIVFVQCATSWAYECLFCKRLNWVPREVGLPTLERLA